MSILDAITGKRLLVIGAHSDDAELFAGGLLLQSRTADLAIAIVTDIAFTNGVLPERDQATLALKEQKRIAARLDATHSAADRLKACLYLLGCQNLRLPGYEQSENERQKIRLRTAWQIGRLLERDKPDIVLTHPAEDVKHPQHQMVHSAVLDLWGGPLWTWCKPGEGETVEVDWEAKLELLKLYDGPGHASGQWKPYVANVYRPWCGSQEGYQKVR